MKSSLIQMPKRAETSTSKKPAVPFIIAHVVPNLDAPEIRQAVAKNYLQSMGMLFEIPASGTQKALSAKALHDANEMTQEAQALPSVLEGFDEGEYPDIEDGDGQFPLDGPRFYCVDCGLEIIETQNSKGKTWTAEAIAGYSEKAFGRCICPNCQRHEGSTL